MEFIPGELDAMLNGFAQDFAWRRGYACPCVNPHSGSPRPDCPHCHGVGRTWGDAVTGSVAVGSQAALKKMAAFGFWDAGDILCSLPSDSPVYEVGVFDRLLCLNRTEPFSVNVQPGVNDRLLRLPLVSVERVFWYGADGRRVDACRPVIVPEDVLRSPAGDPVLSDVGEPQVAAAHLDFEASGCSGPPAGVAYSVTGRRRVEYFVYLEIPVDRPLHHGARLPRRVVARRFDLYGRA